MVVQGELGDLVKIASPQDDFFGRVYLDLSGELSQKLLENYLKYKLDNGVLYYEWRLCIPNMQNIQEYILRDCHGIMIAGHPGFSKTYRKVQKSFFWTSLKTMVKYYILGCEAWHRTKAEKVR